MAPSGGAGACVPTKDESVSSGRNGTVGAPDFFTNEPLHHYVGDHVLSVEGAFIFGKGSKYDFDVVLLRTKQMFSTLEQLVSCSEVVDHHLVADGGAEDSLTMDEGYRIAGEEMVHGILGLVRHAWVRQLHTVAEL